MIERHGAWYNLIFVVAVLYVLSNIITIMAGISPDIAIIENTLASLQVTYTIIPYASATNPYILVSKFLDTIVFALLTVILAAWFFDFINNAGIRQRFAISTVKGLRGHIIVVPYNSFAHMLLHDFKNAGIKTVAITTNKKELHSLFEESHLAILGDIKSADTFRSAGIERAKYVIACGLDDIQNTLITITAKAANPNIKVIATISKEENIPKLDIAGAERTIMPEISAGERIGMELVRKVVSESK